MWPPTNGESPEIEPEAHLPPVGWVELATKGDLAEVRGELAEPRGEVHSLLPKLIAANVASMVGVAGLVLAAASIR